MLIRHFNEVSLPGGLNVPCFYSRPERTLEFVFELSAKNTFFAGRQFNVLLSSKYTCSRELLDCMFVGADLFCHNDL